jgi:hypothetical protein
VFFVCVSNVHLALPGIFLGASLLKATVDVEADETQVKHWCVETQVDGVTAKTWYWYIWLGVLQRGCPDKFWIRELPLSTSREKARMPKLKNETWAKHASSVFTAESNVVLMTDSCSAYLDVGVAGVVDKHAVNHSEGEYFRSTEVLANVLTRTVRPGMAGTGAIDQATCYKRHCGGKCKLIASFSCLSCHVTFPNGCVACCVMWYCFVLFGNACRMCDLFGVMPCYVFGVRVWVVGC